MMMVIMMMMSDEDDNMENSNLTRNWSVLALGKRVVNFDPETRTQ